MNLCPCGWDGGMCQLVMLSRLFVKAYPRGRASTQNVFAAYVLLTRIVDGRFSHPTQASSSAKQQQHHHKPELVEDATISRAGRDPNLHLECHLKVQFKHGRMSQGEVTYHSLDIENEDDFYTIKSIIGDDLSEPYSIYVYRFFLTQWPNLCFVAKIDDLLIGVIICKLEPHRNARQRGYIGMIAVKKDYRGRGIAKRLVKNAIQEMIDSGADEVMLETEAVNIPALALYENMGFLRSKRLYRYYMNQHDAYRLILPITQKSTIRSGFLEPLDPNAANQQ